MSQGFRLCHQTLMEMTGVNRRIYGINKETNANCRELKNVQNIKDINASIIIRKKWNHPDDSITKQVKKMY